MTSSTNTRDRDYLTIIRRRLATCKNYKPKFGKGKDISLSEFRTMYQSDAFYSWFGLDNPLMYAAHKAAGGMTSIYRQIGLGCEEVFRSILMDELGLTNEQANWSYTTTTPSGKQRTLHLDGRIHLADVRDDQRKNLVSDWMADAAKYIQVNPAIVAALQGPVFEVRQGYKSKDSKRQNADVANASTAYKEAYLPTVVLLSTQIDDDIAIRYQASGLLLLYGTVTGNVMNSTYMFCREILGYDLAAFFERNKQSLQSEVDQIAQTLLSP